MLLLTGRADGGCKTNQISCNQTMSAFRDHYSRDANRIMTKGKGLLLFLDAGHL